MQTFIIYNQCIENDILYMVVPGDLTRFDGLYLGDTFQREPFTDQDREFFKLTQKELEHLIYDTDGNIKVPLRTLQSWIIDIQTENILDYVVIECGNYNA